MNVFALFFSAILFISTANIVTAQQQAGGNRQIRDLELGKPIERELAPADTHSYRITLRTGEFLKAVVDQRGIDVVVAVYSPENQKVFEGDSPNGDKGPEPINLQVKTSGSYRIDVFSLEKNVPIGRYEIRAEEVLSADQYAAFLAANLAAKRSQLDTVKQWLADNAIPLRTVEAGNGFADMQPLKKIIGNAHLVTLGEATHGTREFFQLKHRMLEFLVSEMGSTVFGIEGTMPEGFDVNEYVLTGKGDPVKALAGLYFWTWDTEEVLDMIRWMRQYNADPRHYNKVKFYGFDMQSMPRAIRVVLNYLRRVDPEQATASEKALAVLINPFTSSTAQDFASLPKDKKDLISASVNSLLTRFDGQKQTYIKQTSESEWALARQHARILSQSVEMYASPNLNLMSIIRDRSMAENIGWILKHEGQDTKMVVWAHNGHVSTRSTANMTSMGAHLRKMFGQDMIVFGFAFNQGSFQALEFPQTLASEKGLRSFSVGPAPEGSLDSTLAAAGLSVAAINLHALPEVGTVTEWFHLPQKTRSIGAIYSKQFEKAFFTADEVTRLYDAVLFVETTASARPAEGGGRPGSKRLTAPANLDFEIGDVGKPPVDWIVPAGINNFNFQVTASDDNPCNGKRCVLISHKPNEYFGETFGSLKQLIDAGSYRGKKMRLRAAARTEANGSSTQAYIWLRILKNGELLKATFYDNMADRPITSKDWSIYEIAGEVPMGAETIDYGFAVVGDGKAWSDEVSIQTIEK